MKQAVAFWFKAEFIAMWTVQDVPKLPTFYVSIETDVQVNSTTKVAYYCTEENNDNRDGNHGRINWIRCNTWVCKLHDTNNNISLR